MTDIRKVVKKLIPTKLFKKIEQKPQDEKDILISSIYVNERPTNQEGIVTSNDEG